MTSTADDQDVLRTLRSLVPDRRLAYAESLQIAELQANRLLQCFEVTSDRVPSEIITELPRVEVRFARDLPVSGSAHWEAGQWIITLNATEPTVRQRFSLFHEFKHVVDHNQRTHLYGDIRSDRVAAQRAERTADHFAACVLMPKRNLKRQWCETGTTLDRLSRRLGVSTRALSVRLYYLGLDPQTQRCAQPTRRYERQLDGTLDRELLRLALPNVETFA